MLQEGKMPFAEKPLRITVLTPNGPRDLKFVSRNYEINTFRDSMYNYGKIIHECSERMKKEEYEKIKEEAQKQYKFRYIFLPEESVSQVKDYLDETYDATFLDDSDKDHLLKVFMNLTHKTTYILDREKGTRGNRIINRKKAEDIEKIYLIRLIDDLRKNYSREEVLEQVKTLEREIEDEFVSLREKEKYFNAWKKLDLVVDLLKKFHNK